jgi:hypothetical protein
MKITAEKITATVVPREDGKKSVHVFGSRCHCVSLNYDEGTITLRTDGAGIEFTVPAFGPDPTQNKLRILGLTPGDECWIELTRFSKPA